MPSALTTWIRGLAQLRHASLVRRLGELRFEAEAWECVCGSCPGAKIERDAIIKNWQPGQLVVEPGAAICAGTVLALGEAHAGHGRILVGAGTWIGQFNNVRACAAGDIVIGKRCLISQFCTLVSSNHGTARGLPILQQPSDPQRLGVVLGDDVWLGAGATVLPGVTIGTGAVIAANSVVTESVPSYEIWAGSPASHKGRRDGAGV